MTFAYFVSDAGTEVHRWLVRVQDLCQNGDEESLNSNNNMM